MIDAVLTLLLKKYFYKSILSFLSQSGCFIMMVHFLDRELCSKVLKECLLFLAWNQKQKMFLMEQKMFVSKFKKMYVTLNDLQDQGLLVLKELIFELERFCEFCRHT